jgi:hypothetical protein
MECIIRIVDGQPFEHPILMDNFMSAFPRIDVNNLPSEYAKFERLEQPVPIEGQTHYHNVGHHYVFDSAMGKWKDDWFLIDMTDAEKTAKRAEGETIATKMLADLKQFAQTSLDSAPDEQKASWQQYLDQLNALTYDDPFNITWPPTPSFDR